MAAVLVHRAVGDRLTCIFVDHGLLRLHERDQVEHTFRRHLRHRPPGGGRERGRSSPTSPGVTDPETKRKRIGHRFIDVFEQEAKKVGSDVGFLVQGTLYPDVIESMSPQGGPSVTIKTHHNVGGLPEKLPFKLIEPLRELFKDEVRQVGRELGLPEEMVGPASRSPGPGLAIRILGEVSQPPTRRAAQGGPHLHRGDPRGRPVRRDLAGLRGAAPDPLGGRPGRRPELRPGGRRCAR